LCVDALSEGLSILGWLWLIWVIGLIGLGHAIFTGITSDNYVLVIFLGIVSVVWICTFLLVAYQKRKFAEKIKSLPLSTEPATAISKSHEKTVVFWRGVADTSYSYSVVFEFPDKRQEKFIVNDKQYALIQEGDTGILNYKKFYSSLSFVDFQSQG